MAGKSTESTTPMRGWSKAGAESLGRRWPNSGDSDDCYYCGVPGCTECGPPPALLSKSGIIPDGSDDDEDWQDWS